ncbi:3-hydroxyacyl-ACP dehydratase FabZ family protein [Lignipirellula cremea]|uniref:3-hydroxyacyl-[acyl-carrier-protein] dehydratase FabZ n=1 Tax=Lignipirellula cremea TaxID=2528010 RepID=A0A518DWG2_9BACT|nr:3-hydroxyacyl-ACP dehydratase FabZ family protein [Lignipirellula cremea]QDU96177.1 3-hydroxyacyl-[acyl-carrier-protein] dehydratase FabZ [Lignipirellula cremea]
MRWFWIDRFIDFESGRRAVAIKNVSIAEEQCDEYFAGYIQMPSSIIIEGMAQTGGMLVSQLSDFKDRVVLAKISKCVFHTPAFPGETLTYTCEVETLQSEGAVVQATSRIGDRVQAEAQLMFAYLDDARFEGVELFEPVDFLATLKLMHLFDVGRMPDGGPVPVPDWMAVAEAAAKGLDAKV